MTTDTIIESIRSISDEHFSGHRISRHKINWIIRELEVTIAKLKKAEDKLAALCDDPEEDEEGSEVLHKPEQVQKCSSFHHESGKEDI